MYMKHLKLSVKVKLKSTVLFNIQRLILPNLKFAFFFKSVIRPVKFGQ